MVFLLGYASNLLSFYRSCLKIGLLREELRCCIDNEYYLLINQGNEQSELGLLVAKITKVKQFDS